MLVLSTNWLNDSNCPTVAVIPITSRNRGLAHHVPIPVGTAGLRTASFLLLEHTRFVDRRRLEQRIGTAPPEVLMNVSRVLRQLLDA